MLDDQIPLDEVGYSAAFARVAPRLTANQRAMLKYHLQADRPVTATELAEHVGFSRHNAVNAQYGRVGRYLREVAPELAQMPGQKSFAFASFHKVPRADGAYSEWEWTLHAPVRRALRKAPWLS